MRRREFLRIAGATAVGSAWANRVSGQTEARATVLFDGQSVSIPTARTGPRDAVDALWIRKSDLPRVNGFELKPEGACRADICIPVPRSLTRGAHFDLTGFARRVRQAVVADGDTRVWSFGEMPVLRGTVLSTRTAPDVAAPDRHGRMVRLSSFRGKKVLLVTWASW